MMLTHLRMDRDFEAGDVPQDWLWINIDLDGFEVDLVTELVNKIVARKPQKVMGYSFVPPGKGFSVKDGEIIAIGFTCSTYAMAVFDSVSIPLIDEATWEPRESDKWWQIEFVAHVTKKDAMLGLKLDAEVGALRFRPGEVAGAGSVGRVRRPVKFKIAEKLAEKLLHELKRTRENIERRAAKSKR